MAAIEWFNLARAAGHRGAQCTLAYVYQKGIGVAPDPARACTVRNSPLMDAPPPSGSREPHVPTEHIDLLPILPDGAEPRKLDGKVRILVRGRGLKFRRKLNGYRLTLVSPGRIWVRTAMGSRYPAPGKLLSVSCWPITASSGLAHPLSARKTEAWPECSARGCAISVLLSRHETVVEIEIFPGQEGWIRLLRNLWEIAPAIVYRDGLHVTPWECCISCNRGWNDRPAGDSAASPPP